MAEQSSHPDGRVQQVQKIGSPLGIIRNPSGEAFVTAGDRLELSVTVSNKGNQSAIIDVSIDATSGPVLAWCVSPRASLALEPQRSSEIVLQFRVPVEAAPGPYDYLLIIDAQKHYPEDTPILYPGRIQVTPFVQETRTVHDPTFVLQPATSSTSPAQLQPGEFLEVQVLVDNRSEQVDRFYLICPGLATDWFTVIYPEALSQAGRVTATDGLELNPTEQGQIGLLLQPPVDTWAGIYAPSIRLHSTNNPDLILLDVVYLQVASVYLLEIVLLTIVGRVKQQVGRFELRLHNRGNTVREVILRARGGDEETRCTYTLTPSQVRLLPGELTNVSLQVQPHQGWRRPFYGRLLNFVVEVEDTQQLPLLNNRFEGALVWEPRPWWQLLLLVLMILGVIGLSIFLIGWLLLRPKPLPRIVEFASEGQSYQAMNNDAIRLNWRITQPQRLAALKLVGLSPDGHVLSGPVVYELSQGIPEALQDFCILQKALICTRVLTDARKGGDYIFELTSVPTTPLQGATPESARTNIISIASLPNPEITAFTVEQLAQASGEQGLTEAVESPIPQREGDRTVLLNWQITHPDQVQALRLLSRAPDGTVNRPLQVYDLSQGLPESLQPFCAFTRSGLSCSNVPTDIPGAGTYIFELTVMPKQELGETLVSVSQQADPIKIEPQEVIPAEITAFQINGVDAPPKYQVQVGDGPTALTLAWKVEGDRQTKVELLPSPGTVARTGSIDYSLSQTSGTETLTLQVTNAAGEQMRRSVIIETFAPPAPPEPSEPAVPSVPPSPGETAPQPGDTTLPGPGGPSNGEDSLAPAELPPQFN